MRFLFAILASLWLLAAPASAEERILNFDSQIKMLKNGTLDVTETIRVNVENVEINHGIYRDFPTRYEGEYGRRIKIGFSLIDARMDGQPVATKQSGMSNGTRVRLGDADSYVPMGVHEYVIRYQVTRELSRFADHDELYWNVTGVGWNFPIDNASATVMLPSPERFTRTAFYTGPQGARGQAATVVVNEPGKLQIQTTAPLGRHEGLTIVAAIPKGVIEAETTASKVGRFLSDTLPLLVSLLAVSGLCYFLYYAWVSVGRDPKPGTIVPLFAPPDGLSPAAVRYITKQKFDNRGFAATLVDMAVKGHVRLVQEKKGFFGSEERRIERLTGLNATPLPLLEGQIISLLAPPGQSVVMDKDNHAIFSAASKALDNSLKSEFSGRMFNLNLGWAAAAIMIWLAALWAIAVAVVFAEDAASPRMLAVSLGGLGVSALLFGLAPDHRSSQRTLLMGAAAVVAALSLLIGFPFIPEALGTGRFMPFIPVLVALPIAISAFWWMSAPTKEGQATIDKIQGFKQYLSVTEKDRLDRMQAPQDSLQLFEKYLPYAIALDVENRWAKRFAGALAAASTAAAATGTQPFLWYSGSHDPWRDTGGFVSSIGGSLATSIASSSVAPGSSSGFGGGGFSGGGGGGGGGGGW